MHERLEVIVIHDSDDVVARLVRHLKGAGYAADVRRAGTREALRAELGRPCRLIVCDYYRPELDVFGILDEVRAHAPGLPVIVVSSTRGEDAAVAAMRAGASDYLLAANLARLGAAVAQQLGGGNLSRESARRVQRSEATLAMMVAQLPAIVWTVDRNLRFTRSIGAGLASLGLGTDELAGRSLDEYFDSPRAREAVLIAHKRALTGEDVRFEMDWGPRLFEAVVQPLTVGGGRIIGVAGVALDVTSRREISQRVMAAQRLESVGRLAGGVAHEFNNALTVISSYIGFLLEEFRGDEEVYADLTVIREAGERAARMTHQLLAYSRHQVMEPEALDLNEVIRELDKLLPRVLGEDVELVLDLATDVGTVIADCVQLQHVVLNLALNARDAMPHGGRLILETGLEDHPAEHQPPTPIVPAGRYARIRVIDNGHGMTPETVTRIFEPFFSTAPDDVGTGLGLATAHGIVSQSGGFIWAQSTPGEGSTFTVLLPEQESKEERLSRNERAVAANGHQATVLLVEDDESVRRAARRALEVGGFHVLEASHPHTAIELADSHVGTIDLLLSDVVMPDMNGVQLSTELVERLPELKVILMSGYADTHLAERPEIAEAALFLQKPFTPQTLIERVRAVLAG